MNFEDGTLDFRLPNVAETKKHRPFTPANFKIMRTLKALRKKAKGKHVIMFRGRALKEAYKGMKNAAKRAGIKGMSPHTLHHTAITWALDKTTAWNVSGLTSTTVETLTRVRQAHEEATQGGSGSPGL